MQKDFDVWNRRKKELNDKTFNSYIHAREIWWCSIGINVGDEEDGKNTLFERPVLIIKKFNQRIVLAVPLTTKTKDNFYYFPFMYDGLKFAAILSQIRLISTSRLSRRIKTIDKGIFEQIRQAIIKKVI
jgi:mRNA interferase MazF